jgi:hypothetical protein
LNERDPEARKYFYRQIPRYYVWTNQSWKTRQRHFNTLGRVRTVSPTEGDCFYLRILLCNVKGARSFQELFKFNDETYGTYKAACLARGLIDDDKEWLKAMEEAEALMLPHQMRSFLSRIFAHCDPVDPMALWERFKNSLAEDYMQENDDQTAIMRAYKSLAIFCLEEGKNLKDILNIPEYANIDLNEAEIVDQESELITANEMYSILNDEQKLIIDIILTKLNIPLPPSSKNGKQLLTYINYCESLEILPTKNIIFVDGPGGTGKTTIYR